jgi:fructosamine-3-kinase
MADINVDELGPVDYVVVGFPADKADFSGAMADELRKLMESGTVRVLDLLLVTKDDDGSISVAELRDHDDSVVGELRALEADLSLMLAVEDVERIGGDLELGSAAAVLVWENTWAAPFASAVRHSGGELLAMGRIPTQALIAAAEEDREAAQAEA